eukprot:11959843-Karenia_brevis.AAC.1
MVLESQLVGIPLRSRVSFCAISTNNGFKATDVKALCPTSVCSQGTIKRATRVLLCEGSASPNHLTCVVLDW